MIILVCFYQLNTFIVSLFINYVIIAGVEDGADGGGGGGGGGESVGTMKVKGKFFFFSFLFHFFFFLNWVDAKDLSQ